MQSENKSNQIIVKKYINSDKRQQGITIISLVVIIVLLIILASVTIKGIVGKDGMLETADRIESRYIIKQYRDRVKALANSIILKDSISGKETTLPNIVENMQEEKWVKGIMQVEEDIIVKVKDGYVYQAYYNDIIGEVFVEFVGINDQIEEIDIESIPEIVVTYNQEEMSINANANYKDGIEKIELIYKEGIIKTEKKDTANFKVTKTGWYQVKATAKNGKTKSVWVRVPSTVTAPLIAVTSDGEQENEWYGKDDKEVEITINAEGQSAIGIYYKTSADSEWKYEKGVEKKLTINTSGRTMIYAYTVDENANESEKGYIEVKYDNIHPSIKEIEITNGELEENGSYTEDMEILLKNIVDEPEGSGVVGYYWWEITNSETIDPEDNQKQYISRTQETYETNESEETEKAEETEEKIKVTKKGRTVLAFQAKDQAGNKSNIKTLTIYK